MKLAETLVALRNEKGWTQAEAARNISIQQSYLSKLENGHFTPSDDVIEKLSQAYGVKPEKFRPAPKRPWAKLNLTAFIPLLGLFLLISGYSSLLYSSTYYTYKTEPLTPVDPSELYFNYHLSQSYKGEKYITEQSGTKYEFTLIATRDIERQENKLLIIVGYGLLLLSIGLYASNLRRMLRAKDSSTEPRD